MPVYEIKKRRQLFGKVYEVGELVNIAVEYDKLPPDWVEYLQPPQNKQETVHPSPVK